MKEPQHVYQPSAIARIARIVIPVLQFVLPSALYKFIYNFLYTSYKKVLYWSYWLQVIKTHFSGDTSKILRAQMTKRLLPYTMGGHKALENAFDVVTLAEQRNISGAIVECGVAEGGTAAMMALRSDGLGTGVRIKWFFDSYEGLPEPTIDDYKNGATGHFIRPLPKGSCLGTLEQVSDLLFNTLGLDSGKIHLVKGWFQDTVPIYREKVGKIAVLRLDGDWYESTKIPLENFYPQVSPGGFIIIDDYATCFGSRKATDEFRSFNHITTPLNPDGRGGVWFEKPAH
nr:TylF/MycF/NovP-related O-methyltransferase [uncultured Desulfobacter sp.]